MELLIFALKILCGLAVLVAGAEIFVLGASRTALALGLRPILIGLTIVAFGTSLPEFVVSLIASMSGQHDLAAANIVGSNIFNVGLILGLAAMIQPLRVEKDTIRRELPFVVLSAIALYGFARDGIISRMEGFLLLLAFAIFLAVCFIPVIKNPESLSANESNSQKEPARSTTPHRWRRTILFLGGGLLLLIGGAKLFTSGSVDLARFFGISEVVIGLTIVAIGTSLPELATSVMASLRRQDDLSVGNITGSNIFNILLIIGVCAVLHPIPVSTQLVQRDMVVMVALSLALFPIMKSGFIISRLEGVLLVGSYVIYMIWVSRSAMGL